MPLGPPVGAAQRRPGRPRILSCTLSQLGASLGVSGPPGCELANFKWSSNWPPPARRSIRDVEKGARAVSLTR